MPPSSRLARPVLVTLLLALLAPASVVAVTGLPDGSGSSGDPGGSLDAPPAIDDGFFTALDFSDPLTIAISVGFVAILATLAFIGGTKFVNADNVLENDARRSIFEYIQENPGSHLRATASALDLSTTNVLWHLRKLESAKLVSSKKFEGYKVFYPVEGGMESKRRAIASSVLKNDNARQILDYLSANPSAHQREIARALGVNHGTVRWHLRKLAEADLVSSLKNDHTTEYFVSDLGQEFLTDSSAASRGQVRAAGAPAGGPPKVPPAAKSTDEY